MSNKYKHGDRVPSDVICARLDVLSDAVTKGRAGIEREFYMSIPAQLDHDADLVLSEAAKRIRELEMLVLGKDENGNYLPIKPFHQGN